MHSQSACHIVDPLNFSWLPQLAHIASVSLKGAATELIYSKWQQETDSINPDQRKKKERIAKLQTCIRQTVIHQPVTNVS